MGHEADDDDNMNDDNDDDDEISDNGARDFRREMRLSEWKAHVFVRFVMLSLLFHPRSPKLSMGSVKSCHLLFTGLR